VPMAAYCTALKASGRFKNFLAETVSSNGDQW
jgi:hypothetical protein